MHQAPEMLDCSSQPASAHDESALFARIADELLTQGWSVTTGALQAELCSEVQLQLKAAEAADFVAAGIGRDSHHTLSPAVRRDKICWIEGHTAAEQAWLDWANRLRFYLNRRLFLGLFSFESHFAHYRPGAFYKKHVDAFKGDLWAGRSHRAVSVVAYFNTGWRPEEGGELLLYDQKGEQVVKRVAPALATLAVFLSEDVPHEVLPASRDRYSIAGWFRVNGSRHDQSDPPC